MVYSVDSPRRPGLFGQLVVISVSLKIETGRESARGAAGGAGISQWTIGELTLYFLPFGNTSSMNTTNCFAGKCGCFSHRPIDYTSPSLGSSLPTEATLA